MNLSQEELLTIFASKHFKYAKEEEIYHCIIKWVQQNIPARKKFLPSLFKTIRFRWMDMRFIEKIIRAEVLINENPECIQMIGKFYESALLPKDPQFGLEAAGFAVPPRFLTPEQEDPKDVFQIDPITLTGPDMEHTFEESKTIMSISFQ